MFDLSKQSLLFLLILLPCSLFAEENPVFSGPQATEKLPALPLKGIIGLDAGEEFDFLKKAGDKPFLLIFFHQRTRPAFAVARTLMTYAAQRKSDGLASAVVFLSADATETEKWMNVVQKHFNKEVAWTISPDGQEGPGAYGLNRNVTLTVLVGKNGKVSENFALIQPSVQADGPRVLKAIVAAIGSGEVPDLKDLAGPQYRGRASDAPARMNDPKLTGLLRSVINKQATEEDVAAAAKKLEAYVKENAAARKELGRIANTVANSDRLANYGIPAAQEQLKKWAKEYPAPAER